MNKAKPYVVVTVSALTLALSAGAAQATQLDVGHAKTKILAPISADQLGKLVDTDLLASLPDHNHDHDNASVVAPTGQSENRLDGTFDV